jgi:hypothetical protein
MRSETANEILVGSLGKLAKAGRRRSKRRARSFIAKIPVVVGVPHV